MPPELKKSSFQSCVESLWSHKRKDTHLEFHAEMQLQEIAWSGFGLQQGCMWTRNNIQ